MATAEKGPGGWNGVRFNVVGRLCLDDGNCSFEPANREKAIAAYQSTRP